MNEASLLGCTVNCHYPAHMAEGNAASQREDKCLLEALGFLIDKQTIGDKWICCRESCEVSWQLLVLTGKFCNKLSQQWVCRAAHRQIQGT